MGRSKDVFTTGDVARLCRVTIRTVIKWYEAGRLEGYKLPGSRDRRFTREAVRRFMEANDIPLAFLEEQEQTRVLVVDDDEGIRRMVVRYLESLGLFDVDSADSGWEAGMKIGSFRPQVLLLDFRLGDTTGDKVVETIRAMDGIAQPAIVIMSAHLTDEDGQALLSAGVDQFIKKPFELTTLRDTVLRHAGVGG